MNYELLIEKLDHSGRGIGKINNKVVFVPFTLPSEKCSVKILKEKKNFYEAELLEILLKSDKRCNVQCPYYYKCGGCDLLHTTYLEQLCYKENKIKNIVSRYTSLSNNLVKKIIPSDNQFNYRNKAVFKVKEKIGFYKKKSYEIIDIDKCLIVDDRINDILKIIKNNINLENISEITIRASKNASDLMICFKSNGYIDEKKIISVLKEKASSLILLCNNNYKTMYGKDYIMDIINNKKFIISVNSFFQVNTLQAKKMYNKIKEYCDFKKDDVVLDLYCGTGTIGIYISDFVKKVIGIEINKTAIMNANENKKINNVSNIEFMCGDAARVISKLKEQIDVVIVDPPRSGIDDVGIINIKEILPNKLIYVSCDPITLARDLDKLKDTYEVIEITPIDMFPNTYHVECVCVMKLR